jgi:hypothetical protein
MLHSLNLHLPQWFNLERRTAGMQESPVVQKLVTMDLCPRFDEALLRPWQSAADTFDRIESEHRFEFLVRRVEVWPVMRCTDFWKHADDDPKKARDFRHGLLYIVEDSRRANKI